MAIEGAWNEAIENFAKDKKERYDFYGDEPEISATTGSILADRGKMLLHHCVDYAKIFEPTFNFLLKQTSTIMSLKAFLRELAATLPNQKQGAAAIQQFLFATNHKEVKRTLKEKRKNLSDN